MAYFAQLDETNTVVQVISVSDNDAPDPAPENSEPRGQAFIASIGLPGRWVQTSYNANFRRHYAGIGMTYSSEHDAFIAPQPYPSWVLSLSNEADWLPPVLMPTEEGYWYEWDEEGQTWTAHEIPELAQP
jgi:hypothetical protein